MKQILLKLDGSGKIPEALLREILDSKEEVELIFDAEEYDELFPVMQKLFNDISVMRIAQAKQRHQIKPLIKSRQVVRNLEITPKAQPKKEDGRERRSLPRWSIHRQARLRLFESKSTNLCIVEDINLKGMCLSMPEPLPTRFDVKMVLMLSEMTDLELETQIPWRKHTKEGYLYGVYFNKIKDADKDRVYQYINSHCSKQMNDKWWA